jgi:hypothetical protein
MRIEDPDQAGVAARTAAAPKPKAMPSICARRDVIAYTCRGPFG